MTELTKPVTRRVQVPRYGLMNVTLAREGLLLRYYGRRTTYTLPYGNALLCAARLVADQRVADRTTKRRAKRGAL